MSSSTTSSAPTSSTHDPPDTLQLEVLETSDDSSDELPLDQELVLATDDLDDDDLDDGQHVRQKKRSRFSLPPINLGRKSKGKYSRVTAEHATTTSTTHHKPPQPVINTYTAPRTTTTTTSHSYPSSHSDGSTRSCLTWFNVLFFFSVCLSMFGVGFIGYVIGRRSLNSSSHSSPPVRLIVLSLDGFAATYLSRHRDILPNLTAIAAASLTALPLTPVYPSSTFPNHYTLITGLYPTEHGIVANRMYNKSSDEWFVVGDSLTDASYWWLGEPVWSTAQRQGLTSAVLNWPGSDKVIGGRRPTVWAPYNGRMTDAARVQQLMTWLDTNACTLCMVYFSTVDSYGHEYGPLSDEMGSVLAAMDATVGSVRSGLMQRGLWDSVSLMIVSDHGMTSVNTSTSPLNDKLVLIDHYTNITDYLLVYDGPLAHILPTNNATAQQLYTDLTAIHSCTAYNSSADDVPAEYHYSFADSNRIQPILLICELGIIVSNSTYVTEGSEAALKGAHGYLGSEVEMGAILMVHGAGVSEAGVSVTLNGTQSVDVYGLMCKLLDVAAASNDGDMNQFRKYLI